MKVMMVPHWDTIKGQKASGIQTLIGAWFKHLPAVGIELVDQHATSFDLIGIHAGMSQNYGVDVPLVAHLHGLYWTGDYEAEHWEWKANRDVIDSIHKATTVTVPSAWVAETFKRDMHLSPEVVGHGIDWQDWQHEGVNDGYVLWNKNRSADVCSPAGVGELAKRFPKQKFLTTFAPQNPTSNIKATGLVPHAEMKGMVQRAGVYLSTTKETFGIGILEAMASGVPVLGFGHGGILESVKHGVNGYLAAPGDYDDLAAGLDYCLKHRQILGANGREMVKRFTWEKVAQQLRGIYDDTLLRYHAPADVTVIIPCYNYADKLPRAVASVLAQTYHAKEIIIIDNNSSDNTKEVAAHLAEQYQTVRYVNEPRQGVAHARNRGIAEATTKYIVPLDADDEIKPGFIEVCVKALEADRSLALAYTRLEWVKEDGATGLSEWPGLYNYDGFLRKQNQVPTCCMYRRDVALRLGGYRQRYAPEGQGAEDAEFWLRMGAYGYGAKLATVDALFRYHLGGRVSGNRQYQEPDWLAGKPWIQDKKHPFSSLATSDNRYSHPVRQYDEPVISVVIPCGPNHQQYLVDALDSLEAQTFRKWEAIVICDGFSVPDAMHTAYPFARWLECTSRGAGSARNLGASNARGKLLLFLDADDWLKSTALEKMYAAWSGSSAITYSDYIGHAYIDDNKEIAKLQAGKRLLKWDEKTHEAAISYEAFDYDCELAIQQPYTYQDGKIYIWCNVSSLVPKIWHDEIGGFDESMKSWEDWDYWIRMARAGKCFVRVTEPLLNYRFYTGQRRELASADNESARQLRESLIQYMTVKYAGGKAVAGCSGCGAKRVSSNPAQIPVAQMSAMFGPGQQQVSANDIVWVRLNDGNIGEHGIIGSATRQNYNPRKHGDVFKMFRVDALAKPHHFVIVPDPNAQAVSLDAPKEELPPPVEFARWEKETA